MLSLPIDCSNQVLKWLHLSCSPAAFLAFASVSKVAANTCYKYTVRLCKSEFCEGTLYKIGVSAALSKCNFRKMFLRANTCACGIMMWQHREECQDLCERCGRKGYECTTEIANGATTTLCTYGCRLICGKCSKIMTPENMNGFVKICSRIMREECKFLCLECSLQSRGTVKLSKPMTRSSLSLHIAFNLSVDIPLVHLSTHSVALGGSYSVRQKLLDLLYSRDPNNPLIGLLYSPPVSLYSCCVL